MSDDTALSVAKELTLALLPKVASSGNGEPEEVGERYGKLFTTVIKQVINGINEANKRV